MAVTINTAYDLCKVDALLHPENFIVGLECEVESISGWVLDGLPINVKEDGSLRNYGFEFITFPVPAETALSSIKIMYERMRFHNKEEAFSERTSTHVHVNCCALTVEQTRNLVLLYALFEEYFFKLVKPERRDNIHCVPLSETHLSSRYARPIQEMTHKWSKYTALNILPLKTLGTVEFRHMHGTDDVEKLGEWLNVLQALYYASQDVAINSSTLRSDVWIEEYFRRLFKGTQFVGESLSNVKAVISNSLIDLKLAV